MLALVGGEGSIGVNNFYVICPKRKMIECRNRDAGSLWSYTVEKMEWLNFTNERGA